MDPTSSDGSPENGPQNYSMMTLPEYKRVFFFHAVREEPVVLVLLFFSCIFNFFHTRRLRCLRVVMGTGVEKGGGAKVQVEEEEEGAGHHAKKQCIGPGVRCLVTRDAILWVRDMLGRRSEVTAYFFFFVYVFFFPQKMVCDSVTAEPLLTQTRWDEHSRWWFLFFLCGR